jgi:hypothetical protein
MHPWPPRSPHPEISDDFELTYFFSRISVTDDAKHRHATAQAQSGDPHLAAVESALKAATLALKKRDRPAVERAIMAIASLALGQPAIEATEDQACTRREIATAVRTSRRKAMLAELERLKKLGHGRCAPMLAAKKFAMDPLDPVEVASLAQKIRRWLREEIRTVCVSPPKTQV